MIETPGKEIPEKNERSNSTTNSFKYICKSIKTPREKLNCI